MPHPNFNPLIKWTGAKRYAAEMLVSMMPPFDGEYVEPFVGGGSVARCVFNRIAPKRMRLSDSCRPLVAVWNAFSSDSDLLVSSYRNLWELLRASEDKNACYSAVRDSFNMNSGASEFLFLIRTAFNGLIRFNASGKFNAPYHHGRLGISPDRLLGVVSEWADFLKQASADLDTTKPAVSFECLDYGQIACGPDDFVFLDPPYGSGGTHVFGFDAVRFWEWVASLKCRWIITYDVPIPVPFRSTVPLPRCVSGFGKLKLSSGGGGALVREAAYANFEVANHSASDF